MKTNLSLLIIYLGLLTSCATVYKSVQTPDDVYFSPAHSFESVEKKQHDKDDNLDQGQQVNNYYNEDRLIRMGISNSRWRSLNYDYGYSAYNVGIYTNPFNNLYYNPYGDNNYGFLNNHFFNNGYYNNLYYNQYPTYPVYFKPTVLPKITAPRTTNLAGYGRNYNNSNSTPVRATPSTKSNGSYNNSNNTRRSGLGEILNKVFAPAPANNNYQNNNVNSNQQQRSYTPPPANSNSSSSGRGSSNGASGRISRPN